MYEIVASYARFTIYNYIISVQYIGSYCTRYLQATKFVWFLKILTFHLQHVCIARIRLKSITYISSYCTRLTRY